MLEFYSKDGHVFFMIKKFMIVMVLLLSSCGMQGDLYLPEDNEIKAVSYYPLHESQILINDSVEV